MINRVRSAQGFAALLLLAAACGDSGGGSDDDKDTGVTKDAQVDGDVDTDGDTPDDDGGPVEDADVSEDGGDTDAGDELDATVMGDATVTMDADTADTGVTTDTGTVDAGGGTDAGVDAGPTLPANCAETAVVAGTGATIASTDTRFSLTLTGGQLSADSTVRVCVIAAANAPAGLDGRLGDAYEITTTPAATFAAASATFRGHSALPPVDATPVFDPLTVRALPTGGSVANGTGAVLRMSKRALAADTVTTLSATIAGPGHVYVAPLEAAGIYRVDMNAPTKTAFVTGEVIDFNTVVTVTGSPVGARIFEAEVNGCRLDPVNYASTAGDVVQPGPVTNRPGCIGDNYVAVTRRGGLQAAGGNIVGGSTVGGAALTGGTTLDFRAQDSTPFGLYCRFIGAGKGATRLFFKTGTTTDLEVVKDIEVTCTYSGDLVAVYDQVDITRASGAGYVVGTTYSPRSYIAIQPPAITYTAVGADAVRFPEPVAVLSGDDAEVTFTAEADIQSGTDPAPIVHTATNTVSFAYVTDRYTATNTNAAGFFSMQPRADLHIRQGGTLFDCYAPSSAIDLRLSNRNGASSTVAVLDSTLDAISIRARYTTGGNTVVQRWVDASLLSSHQPVPFLTSEQQTALASLGAATEYAVGLYKIAWDEQRRLWDGGRIVPVACGTVLLFEAADVLP